MTNKEYTEGVNIWSDGAYAFALRCGGDSEVGKDAVQEAFATLWEHRHKVDFEKGRAYVLTIVYRQVMNHFRQQSHLTVADNLPDTPSHTNENFDLKAIIEQCLQRLLPQQRAILQLRDIEGYSYKEISNILDISDQQVMVYIYRARVAMKRHLLTFGIEGADNI